MTLLILIAAGLLLLLAIALFLPRAPGGEGSYCANERSHMPPEVASGRLVLSETTLRVRRPAKIVAKPDQVYLTRDRQLVLVENKTRRMNQVYDYDRAELAVQGFVLRHGRLAGLRRYRVAPYGYVAIRQEGGPPRFHRVDLLTDEAIVSMRQRRLDVELARVPPSGPVSNRVCPKCSKRTICPKVNIQPG